MGGKKSQITNSVKDARLRADLSQAALGDEVGVTRQTIIAIEGQRYSPSLELAFRLSHVLGEPIDALFQFDGEWD